VRLRWAFYELPFRHRGTRFHEEKGRIAQAAIEVCRRGRGGNDRRHDDTEGAAAVRPKLATVVTNSLNIASGWRCGRT
jgi:DeoR/GlpR family transcriptional regulator of sugar metabolism